MSEHAEAARPVRRGLGRGLGSLIPTAPPRAADQEPTPKAAAGTAAGGSPPPEEGSTAPSAGPALVAGAYFAEVPIAAVRPSHRQPREVFDEEAMAELVFSIREVGLLQPVVVRPLGDDTYELVMGERRWRASQQAGLTTIPAIVRETGDDVMLRDALLENLHRAQLNPLEEIVAVGDAGGPTSRQERRRPLAPGLTELGDRLSDRLETRVKIDLGKTRGKITVEFATMDDLRRIVAIMDPRPDADADG